MRLAFLTHEPFYPPSGGGSAEAVYLVLEMVRRGHEVHLFCPWFPDSDRVEALIADRGVSCPEAGKASNGPANRATAPGAGKSQLPGRIWSHLFSTWQMNRYTSLRNFKYLVYPFFLERMVERAARTTRFDIILSQHAISAVAAGRLKRRLHLPVVMNFLDYLTGFMETWPRYVAPRSFIKALERFELSLPLRHRAEGVMTVSDTLADYFANAGYPRNHIRPIYYGYDAKLFCPAESAGTGDGARSPVIVMHGSFDQHHLGTVAASAVALVTEKRPETRFKFVGKQTPALINFCKRVGAAVPRARMECAGFVPYAEIAGHLSSASVGIVPYEESTGTHCAFVAKIVEYLGVGLPVVSTALNSAMRYFGNEPAVRFSEFNGESFGREILKWLDEPAERRQAIARAASQRVQAGLDWSAISKNAVDFVEEIHRRGPDREQSKAGTP